MSSTLLLFSLVATFHSYLRIDFLARVFYTLSRFIFSVLATDLRCVRFPFTLFWRGILFFYCAHLEHVSKSSPIFPIQINVLHLFFPRSNLWRIKNKSLRNSRWMKNIPVSSCLTCCRFLKNFLFFGQKKNGNFQQILTLPPMKRTYLCGNCLFEIIDSILTEYLRYTIKKSFETNNKSAIETNSRRFSTVLKLWSRI